MESVSIKPGRRQIKMLILGVCALCILMVYMPQLCLPIVLILPLLACPLVGRSQGPVVFMAAVIPAVASLMAGCDALYAASLALPVLLPLLVAKFVPLPKQAGMEGMLWYISSVAAGLLAVLASVTYVLGGPLWQTLPELFGRIVQSNEQAGLILYRFAAAGLVPLPEGYESGEVLQHAFDPVFVQQLLLSVKMTMERLMFELLPSYYVQLSLIVGVFAALRVQKISGVVLVLEAHKPGEKKARVALPPGFAMLRLPPQARGPVLLAAVASLVLMMMQSPLLQIMGHLYYALFESVFRLVGAAVLVFVLSAKHPKYKILFGVLTAAAYVIAPFLLFLIGVTDQTFHYRVKRSGHPD